MIGVTGASGHLGQALMCLLPEAYPIGRTMPDIPLTGLIHAAAPDYRDNEAVVRFHDFNILIDDYVTKSRIRRFVIVGSWWQHAQGNCKELLYTKMKDHQRRMFNGTHVLPYSIYGDESRPGRGFIPQLIQAIRGETNLKGLSGEQRDFIHVTDVARACIIALDAPKGIYIAGTRDTVSPRELAGEYEIDAPDYKEYPSAAPVYLARSVPAWEPLVNLRQHINQAVKPAD